MGRTVIPSHILWHDFLPLRVMQDLQNVVLDNQDNFTSSGVGLVLEKCSNLRQSLVLYDKHFMEFSKKFADLIRWNIPTVQQQLELDFQFAPMGIALSFVDVQITASGDGHFYKTHVDDDLERASRIISFVFYFRMTEDQKFTGGSLRLRAGDEDIFIAPEHNSIVWFSSHLEHEIMEVSVPSQKFLDSRFTCNGWVNKPFISMFFP